MDSNQLLVGLFGSVERRDQLATLAELAETVLAALDGDNPEGGAPHQQPGSSPIPLLPTAGHRVLSAATQQTPLR